MYRRVSLLLLTLLGGCAPSTHVTAYRQAPPRANARGVEVFTDARPDRPWTEIGTIEMTASELSDDSHGDLIRRAQREAAKLGGDAILVTLDSSERITGMAVVPSGKRGSTRIVPVTGRKIETPRIRATVVVWEGVSGKR